ncbi:MAG: hypothetical protein B0D91_11135 [Oceanospirillales bacterium LUC14_002_19_P2]|nr:MAG: hypothetical protein B0D91_11135 [Oceanospirillales bacterium LUC14_002_19_P2]
MTESKNRMFLLDSLELAYSQGISADVCCIDITPGRPSLIELALVAFLEAGPAGLRQEQVYPPVGRKLSTGDTYTTGNLRNQVCELRKKDIRIIGWIDPYQSRDGRVTYYKRYAFAGSWVALRAALMINQYRRARGAPRIPFYQVLRFFLSFPSDGKE